MTRSCVNNSRIDQNAPINASDNFVLQCYIAFSISTYTQPRKETHIKLLYNCNTGIVICEILIQENHSHTQKLFFLY